MKTMPERNGEVREAKTTERSRVKVVDGDPPMLRLEINLHWSAACRSSAS